MSKVIDTFYKGNIDRFGLGGWNSVKDDFIEVSKSTQIPKKPFTNNINNDPSNIYKPQIRKYPENNHFSPDLIRMQYFNSKILELENKRNNQMKDFIKNAKYNVYNEQYDPLIGRRRNVKRRLENIKNKLLNDEEEDRMRIQKEIEEENRIIDDLILENKKSPKEIINKIFNNNEENNIDKNYNFDEVDKYRSGLLSNNNSKKITPLLLSRTSSKEDSFEINNKFLPDEDEESVEHVSPNKSIYTKSTKISKRNSVTKTKSTSQKKKPKHTDIMKILTNMEKYSVPPDSAQNELLAQSKQAGISFNDLYYDIKELKKDFNEKLSKLNEITENNISDIKEILMMCENENLRNAIDNVFNNKGKRIKNKNYLDSEVKQFKKQIEKTIDEVIDNYGKNKILEAYNLKLQNEPVYMENDFNYRIKGNERSKFGKIHFNNLYNQIQKRPNVGIKSNLLDAESAKSFSSANTINSNIFTFSNNSLSNFFPALKDLNEKNTCIISEKEEENVDITDKKDKKDKKEKKRKKKDVKDVKDEKDENKKKKKKIQRDAFVVDLGMCEEEYDGHRDEKKRERKETIFEIKDESKIESDSKTIIYTDSFNDERLYQEKKKRSENKKIIQSENKKEEKDKKKIKSENKKEPKEIKTKDKKSENKKVSNEKNNINESENKKEENKSKPKTGSKIENKKSQSKNNKNKSKNNKEEIKTIKEEPENSQIQESKDDDDEDEDEDEDEELEEEEESEEPEELRESNNLKKSNKKEE